MESAFLSAREILSEANSLFHYDITAPLALFTDALQAAIGGVFQQYVNGNWQPIRFFFRVNSRPLKYGIQIFGVSCLLFSYLLNILDFI